VTFAGGFRRGGRASAPAAPEGARLRDRGARSGSRFRTDPLPDVQILRERAPITVATEDQIS
jgi:hypothetical protein